MSVAATTGPAAGWYPHPHDAAALRWWDGVAWTDHSTPVPAAPTAGSSEAPALGGTFRSALAAERAERTPPGAGPVPDPAPQPGGDDASASPEARPDAIAARVAGRRRPIAIAAVAALAAAAGAGIGVVRLGGDDATTPARAAATSRALAAPAADMACVKAWNTGGTRAAVDLRVTLGQFQGAYAAVKRVQPLGGTVMTPNSCALSVYVPGQDTHAIFVDGVEGEDGYLDVTGYPRAAQLGWPKTAEQANVRVERDGSVTALAP